MAQNTVRRGTSILGAAGLMALALAAPVSARPEDGSGQQPGRALSSHQILPANGCAEEGAGLSTDQPKSLVEDKYFSYWSSFWKPVAPAPRVIGVAVNDNSVEYLQIGAGLIAGMALTGTGVLARSRRHRTQPMPA